MQILACQYDILWENRAGNFDKVRAMLQAEKIAPESLIVLPEMFSSGFSMNVARVAEEKESGAEAFMKELAQNYKSWVIGGLVFPQPGSEKGRNELAVFGPDGELIGRYQKNHTFGYTGESEHYDPGKEVFLFEAGGFKICPVICYDLRFPELFRRGVQRGANCFVVIASWPSVRIDHWVTLLRARAIENQAVVIGVNRVGEDPKYQYVGRTLIVNEHGAIVADAEDEERCLTALVSPESVTAWREEFRALDDMRMPKY